MERVRGGRVRGGGERGGSGATKWAINLTNGRVRWNKMARERERAREKEREGG